MKKYSLLIFFLLACFTMFLDSAVGLAWQSLKLASQETSVLEGRLKLKLPQGFKKSSDQKSSSFEAFGWEEGVHRISLAFEETRIRISEKGKTEVILLQQAQSEAYDKKFNIQETLEGKGLKVYLLGSTPPLATQEGMPFLVDIVDQDQMVLIAKVFIYSDSEENFSKLAQAVKASLATLQMGKALELNAREELLTFSNSDQKISIQIPKNYYFSQVTLPKIKKDEYLIGPIQELGVKGFAPSSADRLMIESFGHAVLKSPAASWDSTIGTPRGTKKVVKKLFGQDQTWWVDPGQENYYRTWYAKDLENKNAMLQLKLSIWSSQEKNFQNLEKIVESMKFDKQ